MEEREARERDRRKKKMKETGEERGEIETRKREAQEGDEIENQKTEVKEKGRNREGESVGRKKI